jgi:hypothetical protein
MRRRYRKRDIESRKDIDEAAFGRRAARTEVTEEGDV